MTIEADKVLINFLWHVPNHALKICIYLIMEFPIIQTVRIKVTSKCS